MHTLKVNTSRNCTQFEFQITLDQILLNLYLWICHTKRRRDR